ncbi:hydroxymethylglutaryl-CoA synthase family protein [Xylocopilactobacillus apicola]|uniref:Hydroxymethylglutaryl-CoA synthase n=1 Tax=Xylocopilactobacillus apicola TaxID=2932184 RepID=A0AAU9CXY6_9LACO|nr:hydroxymethylglutaryl-CoA synthase [Xylocopilactobacillus apicola]BDR58882.1 hydroxymethylglutaryl-CoA synthase [Xylocopilactobacillus apicola]
MIGISKITGYIPQKYVEMEELATARGVDPQKFLIGIGQEKMAIVGGNEDSVSMALNAGKRLIEDLDPKEIQAIKLVILATESSIDEAKASALFLEEYLDLPKNARYLELKEACYGATAGLNLAFERVTLHPDEKVLVIASDLARYGLNSKGEVTQGAGSIALLVENRLDLALESLGKSTYHAENVSDFYRPMGQKEAIVDGPLSNETYLRFFKTVFEDYFRQSSLAPSDLKLINFHLPYTKIGLKALKEVADQVDDSKYESWIDLFNQGKAVNAVVGNIYTGSLYLNLLSNLLSGQVEENDLLGMYSYGSGAQAEFFVLRSHKNFDSSSFQTMLQKRQGISVENYEKHYCEQSYDLEQKWTSEGIRSGDFYLKSVENGNRKYDKA